jgi:hypothetical protein
VTRKEKSQSTKPGEKSRLEELRRGLTTPQCELLNEFWQHYRRNTKWPLARTVHSQRGKQAVRERLQQLGGDIVVESQDSSSGRHYELTIIGVLLTDAGSDYFTLLVRYLEFLRKQFKETPERLSFADVDFREALSLSDEQLKILGELVRLSRLWNGGSYGAESWNVQVPDEVEDLPEKGPLDRSLEELLFRCFQIAKPVFIEGRQRQITTTSPLDPFKIDAEVVPSATPITVDALKRRYQVFVSSTYEDLKEERQHVIQALLETKCIPLGMELFPAASVEQWELIKRVIEECDYYVIIVAGRYGSLNDSGVGYTEMEFDYAVSIGKPIIGFYHKNPDSLPGAKLERTDAGRERLKSFTEKIKRRLCRPWSSAAELGSAVKSAILNELEFNPKAGWIRADAIPSSAAVEKLKQRIADLEERLKKKSVIGRAFAAGEERIQIPVLVKYDFSKDEMSWAEEARKKFEHPFEITWDDLVLTLGSKLQEGADLSHLWGTLDSEIKKRLFPVAKKVIGGSNPEFECDSAKEKVDLLLKTLMARKLIKMMVGDYGSWSNPKFRFTPKGLQHLAELQAVRSAS